MLLRLLPFAILLWATVSPAQPLRVTYAGNAGKETFNDVLQLSNGHFLVIGVADDLDWLPANTPLTEWPNPGIANNQGTNRVPFVLELDATLGQMLAAYQLPRGAAEDFTFIKTTNAPGEPTGDVYLSGTTEDAQTGGYFIGKLNNNFVAGQPDGFAWVENVRAVAGGYPKIYQPWDVDHLGRVVYALGDSHAYNWSAIYRLRADGTDDVVPHWRVHWKVGGGEFYGPADAFPGGLAGLSYSAIVFKRDGNRCELRSTADADYLAWLPDGNGGTRRGPLDVLYNAPCPPGAGTASGPGYTGYSPPGTFTYGPSSIAIDRRTNAMYIGFNAKSVLPGGQPDFEPAVMAMSADGDLQWWSRLYHEVTPAGDTVNSSPDQYVDALAIDYSLPAAAGLLVVGARCHGNNVENLWEGDQIAANPGASGFQNRFTGSNGNIHISWLGKLGLADGTLLHSTYMSEYAEGTGGLGAPHPDPNLDGWPNPNAGWPDVNTTYIGKNRLKVTADGSVLLHGVGRRTITTANAWQKMVKPGEGQSCWNEFVRIYAPDLSKPLYSSLVVGQWDPATQAGGDNVRLRAVWKTATGIVAVGRHTGTGAELPVANVPAWGNGAYNDESAVVVHYTAANITNPDDDAEVPTTGSAESQWPSRSPRVFPNPAGTRFTVAWHEQTGSMGTVFIVNALGKEVARFAGISDTLDFECASWPPGLYFVLERTGQRQTMQKLIKR